MRKIRNCSLAVLIMAMLAASSHGEAGNVIHEHLSSLNEVRLFLPNGLQFDPIPGLDLAEMRKLLDSSVKRVLSSHDIRAADTAGATLYISLSKQAIEGSGFYVIVGEIRLVEMARLVRHVDGKDGPEKTEVSTWLRVVSIVSATENVLDDIVREIEWATELFASDVDAARWYSERTKECPSKAEKGEVLGAG